MSILNVNTIQPVGSGQTITVSAANISAPSTVVTASSFVGGVTGNLTGNVTGNVTGGVLSGISTIGVTTVYASGSLQSNSIVPVGGLPATATGGGIIQVFQHKTTTRMSSSSTGSATITATSGVEYTTFNFTPVSAASKLWLLSSTFLIGEGSNVNDAIYSSAVYGGTTIIGSVINYSGSGHWSGALDTSFVSFNHVFDSWGTDQRAISIRVGGVGGGTLVVNYPNATTTYASQYNSPNVHEVTFTMLEVST